MYSNNINMDFQVTPYEPTDSGITRSPFPNAPDDNKRCSSSRSIKPRRFDDELVESSLGLPGASLGKGNKRMLAQSYTSQVDFPATSALVTPAQPPQKRVKKVAGGGSVDGNARQGQLSHLSTKDLGRWKPTDDLALILGVQQTNDLHTVHRDIKFTCSFTLSELQARWHALIYNADISRVAMAAVRNLNPDLVAAVHEQALYSDAEEELLKTLLSTSYPTENKFQELLEKNPLVFYPSRTPKTLMAHWQKLKQYQLLPDQSVQPLAKSIFDKVLSFYNAEDTLNDSKLPDYKEEDMDVEMQIDDRIDKKEVQLLETAASRWQVVVQSIVGGNTEFDNNTFAVLCGKVVRYLIRSREIAVGCSAKDHAIDVDLSLEGPVDKVTKKQATIRLSNNGDFFISSEGKRPIFVDGKPVLQGIKVKLNHNSVIAIAGLHFIFLVNEALISAIRHVSTESEYLYRSG